MDVQLKNRSEYTISFVFFLTVSICGIIGVNWAVSNFAMVRASASWSATEAIVLDYDAGPRDEIRYTYSYGGVVYESKRRSVFKNSKLLEGKRFTPGEKIRIFVNPENHSYSVVEPGGGKTILLCMALVSSVLVFFGFAGLVRILFSQYELARLANDTALPAE
ncbi:MAG: DUF3592 domain-containing protein [Marinicaulis sp.]|nr:DUF3592 domain-containing protein [Marinicaulis sp.]NNE41391.1 DUF3592 domain-containing protein [Marinicaulis sp.]NNL89441.1 DUF3592 domain-containing protein [Marinicaulis sp.]